MNHHLVQMGLRVGDLAASVEHVEATLGLEVVERDGAAARLALPGQAPCLVLYADQARAFDHMGLFTEPANLDEIRSRAYDRGLGIAECREMPVDGIRLVAPNGVVVEVGAGTPPARNERRRDVGPTIGSLDHLSFTARDLDATVAFFIDVLGFRLSDSVTDQRHWLRCGPNHHTVAVFQGNDGLHHYSFEAADIRELRRLGDLLALRGQNLIWGPGRHGLGANIFSYHVDPSGAILEVCTDMIQVDDEDGWVAQVWGEGLASAVMWGPPPPADFREYWIPVRDRAGTTR